MVEGRGQNDEGSDLRIFDWTPEGVDESLATYTPVLDDLSTAGTGVAPGAWEASLNLAQAVLLIGYEWFKRQSDGGLGRETEVETAAREGLGVRDSRPATRAELVSFFDRLEEELDKGGFLRPAEKRPAMIRNIRNMFTRAQLTEQEVRTLHGIVSSLIRKHEQGQK